MSEESSPERSTRYGRLGGLRPDALMAQGIPQTTDGGSALEVDGYKVQGMIGRGGMGTVFLARQVGLDRQVAIKRVAGDFHNDPLLLDRLEIEAQTMAKLSHPNIVTVHQLEKLADGGAAIVMEYVVGGNLRDMIDAHPDGLEIEDALRLVREIASALAAAHRSGVVHRDMKPENVLIDQDSVARVTDFGLAVPLDRESPRLTLTGTTVGTVDYLAPERLDADSPPDARCDIYALGVILYELLTGKAPRGSFAPPRQLRTVIPHPLSEATMKSLRPDPDQRFASMGEFAAALEQPASRSFEKLSWILAAIAGVALLAFWIWNLQQGGEPENTTPSQTAPDAEAWQDLLVTADLETDTVHGGWRREGSSLVSIDDNCILVLSGPVAEPYELRTKFTRISGDYSVGVFITANNSLGTISLDSWGQGLNGVQKYNGGKDLKKTGGFQFTWEKHRQYELRAQVVPGKVTIWVDGAKIEEVDIGETELGVVQPWGWIPDARQVGLAIGAWSSPTRFESFEWRPIESAAPAE